MFFSYKKIALITLMDVCLYGGVGLVIGHYLL